MSTRVQKGTTVFKPVAKPRGRASNEVRQVSAAPEPTAILAASKAAIISTSVQRSTPAADSVNGPSIMLPPPTSRPPAVSQSVPESHLESKATPISIPSRAGSIAPAVISSTAVAATAVSVVPPSTIPAPPSAPFPSTAVPLASTSMPAPPLPQHTQQPPESIPGTTGEIDASQAPSRPSKKRRQSEAPSSQRGKSRAPSLPPFDPSVDPGEELDPTAVTMAALCDDNGRGRVSSKAAQIVSNHAAWRAANKEKRARMRAAMEAKKYGRDLDQEEGAQPNQAAAAATPAPEDGPVAGPSSERGPPDAQGQNRDEFDYSQAMATSRYNVQVRIGPNGETIIDEDSLFVDRNEEIDTAEYTHVEESDTTKFVNSATYSKKTRGSRWSAEETELFFDALSQFGENYELISLLLPGRDRKACKNKFKAEDKKNPERITFCLKNRRPYDIATLSRLTGKDFSGPTPEIRAPTPAQLPVPEQQAERESGAPEVRTKSQNETPDLGVDGEELIGNIDDLDAEGIIWD